MISAGLAVRHVLRLAFYAVSFCVWAAAILPADDTEHCRQENVFCVEAGSVGNNFIVLVTNEGPEVARNLRLTAADLSPKFFIPSLWSEPSFGLRSDLLPSARRTFTVWFDVDERSTPGTTGDIALEVWTDDVPFPRDRFAIVLTVIPAPMGNVRIE